MKCLQCKILCQLFITLLPQTCNDWLIVHNSTSYWKGLELRNTLLGRWFGKFGRVLETVSEWWNYRHWSCTHRPTHSGTVKFILVFTCLYTKKKTSVLCIWWHWTRHLWFISPANRLFNFEGTKVGSVLFSLWFVYRQTCCDHFGHLSSDVLTSEMHFVKFHPEVAFLFTLQRQKKVCNPGDGTIMKIHKKLFSGIPFNFTLFVISPKLQRIWSWNFGFAVRKIWAFIWYQKINYFRLSPGGWECDRHKGL